MKRCILSLRVISAGWSKCFEFMKKMKEEICMDDKVHCTEVDPIYTESFEPAIVEPCEAGM